MCKGGGGSTSQTVTQQPSPEVSAAYKSLLSQAQRVLYPNAQADESGNIDYTKAQLSPYPTYTPEAAATAQAGTPNLIAPFTPMQNAALGGISQMTGYINPYVNAATGLGLAGASPINLQQFSPGAVGQYLSPYLNQVMGSTVANINETNAQQQQQLLGNEIARGAFGGDRGKIAQAELARQQALANNATLANIANTGYTSALGEFNTQQAMDAQRQLQSAQLAASGAQNLGNIGLLGQQANLQQLQALYGGGANQQAQNQANLSTAYQQFLQQQQYPYQQLGWLGGLTSGAASGMGGTTTSSIPQPSTGAQILGGLGMLGSMGGLGNLFGGAGAAGAGTGFLSSLGTGLGAAASGIGSGIGALLAALKDGGRVEENPHFANGGTVADLVAQPIIPQLPPPQGTGLHAPAVPQIKNPNEISNEQLKAAVTGIKSLMGKQPTEKPTDLSGATPPTPMGGSGDLAAVQPTDLQPIYARGGVVAHYADGGITIPRGMMTKEDLAQAMQDFAGSGAGGADPTLYTSSAEGLLPATAAYGGAIHKLGGGSTGAQNPYGIPEDLYPHYQEAERVTGVPISLLAAKDRQESGFSQDRPGRAGEMGIAQILPATARNPGYGMQGVDPETLKDPRQNIMFGAQYLAARGKEAGTKDWNDPQQAAAALRAYNGGGDPNYVENVFSNLPGGKAIAAAMKGAQQTPSREANIPFKETPTKEGLLGALGISATDSDRMALLAASGALMSTPGTLGTGLGRAAQAFAQAKLDYSKNQRELAEAQARGERERASAYETTGRGIKERVQPAATGILTYGQDERGNPIVGVANMPKAGGPAVSLTPPVAGTQQSFTQTAQSAGAPQAPTGPTAQPSSISMQLGPVHDDPVNPDQNNKEAVLKEMAGKITEGQFNPYAGGDADLFKAMKAQANSDAEAATATAPNLTQGIRAFTDTPEEGFLAPGAGAAYRYAAANYFNTLLKLTGSERFKEDEITAKQVEDKLNTLRAQGAQKGLGREAGFWLEGLKKAGPGQELNKETSADILANMLVGNKMSRDRSRLYNEYGGQNYSAGLGSNAQDVFNRVNPIGAYQRDMDAIKNILMDTKLVDGKRENLISMLLKHPDMASEFDARVRNKYKIQNLSSYFVGG
jgi:hypothetical protein